MPAAVAVAWCLLGTVFLETGLATRKPFFRQQGLLLLAGSFVRLFFINSALAPAPRLYTMLPLAALYAYAYQRVSTSQQLSRLERLAGAVTAWLSLGTVATLLYFSLRPEWLSIGAVALVMTLLLLARVLGRTLFSAQAITLILLTAARTLFSAVPQSTCLWGRLELQPRHSIAQFIPDPERGSRSPTARPSTKDPVFECWGCP